MFRKLLRGHRGHPERKGAPEESTGRNPTARSRGVKNSWMKPGVSTLERSAGRNPAAGSRGVRNSWKPPGVSASEKSTGRNPMVMSLGGRTKKNPRVRDLEENPG